VRLAVEHKRPEIKDKICRIIKSETGYEPRVNSGDGALDRINIGGKMFYDYLEINGFAKDDLYIPQKIWDSPSSVQAAYLSGLFDADGYNSGKKKGYCYGTISERLALDIQRMLLSNG